MSHLISIIFALFMTFVGSVGNSAPITFDDTTQVPVGQSQTAPSRQGDVSWTLISGDANDSCSKPTWNGSVTVHGWYVLAYAYGQEEKTWHLKIAREDDKKMPYVLNDLVYGLTGASPQLEAQLKKASASKPVSLTLRGYSLYCEGAPTVSLSEFPKQKVSLVSCVDNLYLQDMKQYDFWHEVFRKLHPDYTSNAGAYCKLNNGDQLVSFSHFSGVPPKGAGQTIILFDSNNNVLKATNGFYCQTLGDLGYPTFRSIAENKVIADCFSGDAGNYLRQTYKLDLQTFQYDLLATDTSIPK